MAMGGKNAWAECHVKRFHHSLESEEISLMEAD